MTDKKWPANEPLPRFATVEEEETFYATHDLGDLFEAAEEVEPSPTAKSNLRAAMTDGVAELEGRLAKALKERDDARAIAARWMEQAAIAMAATRACAEAQDARPQEMARALKERDETRGVLVQAIKERDFYAGQMERVTKERDEARAGWKEPAAQYARNADYFRGTVTQIGDMFGEAARTSDDGSVQGSVLASKVPELVASLRAERDALRAAIAPTQENVERYRLVLYATRYEGKTEEDQARRETRAVLAAIAEKAGVKP